MFAGWRCWHWSSGIVAMQLYWHISGYPSKNLWDGHPVSEFRHQNWWKIRLTDGIRISCRWRVIDAGCMELYSMMYAGSALNIVGGIEDGGKRLTIEGSAVSRVTRSLLWSLCLCLISCLAVRKTSLQPIITPHFENMDVVERTNRRTSIRTWQRIHCMPFDVLTIVSSRDTCVPTPYPSTCPRRLMNTNINFYTYVRCQTRELTVASICLGPCKMSRCRISAPDELSISSQFRHLQGVFLRTTLFSSSTSFSALSTMTRHINPSKQEKFQKSHWYPLLKKHTITSEMRIPVEFWMRTDLIAST